MVEKTKAELEKEADKLGVQTASTATKAELEQAVKKARGVNEPDVFEARFDPRNPPAKSLGPVTDEGPDASAGTGGPTLL